MASRCSSIQSDKENGDMRRWSGPHTVVVHRAEGGFGFTLRHFIVYPPESTVRQLKDEVSNCDNHDGSGPKYSKLEPMDTIFVKHVKEGGPAQQAGLQKGDRIVSVNGHSVTGMSYSQVIALIQSSDTSLKLLVVPKDEDILQMAYQSSAYRQGKEPYKGSATDIPEPPELNVDSGVYQPTRYKSEIHIQTSDGTSYGTGQKLSGFDPRVPRQRLSTSSIGSVSSGSSYSTSKDVGAAHAQMANTDGVEDNSLEVTRAAMCSSRSGHGSAAQCVASSAAESSSVINHNNSHVPPVAPARSSSKNITFINFQQPSLMQHQGHSDFVQPVHCSNQMAAPYTHPLGSMENLEQSSDSASSKTSDSSKSSDMSDPMVRSEPPPSVEKLLRTSYETKYQRPVCDGLRHSSDSLTAPRDQPATSQPRASTTITLTTSTMLPPSGRHPGSQWRSDSQVYKIDRTSPSAIRQSSGMTSSTTDVSASAGYQHQRNGHAQISRPDSYGLTVSLQIDPRHRNYADHEPKAPRRSSERNSVPEHHMINMVSERLKKFESADNVDSGVAAWRQRKPNCYQPGYDSVLSRAAEFESRHEDDDDRTRRKRSTMRNSPFSTPASSTSSLPQVLPPPEINKVPATPPATINFYFREGLSHAQTGSVNIEPSPERLPADASDSFRMRVSSEPPGGALREGRSQDRGHLQTAVTGVSSPVSKRRPATRQPSYLAAVSPAQEGTSSSSETTLATTTGTTSTTTPVTFRERSRSEDREARLVRRTSYLLATGRQRSSGYQDPNRVDVSQLILPPPPSNTNTQGDDDSKLSRTKLQLPTSSGSGPLGQCKEVSEPSTESLDYRSPPPPLTPTTTAQSPNPDTATTPTKTSNIKKLKLLFGEKTPRILEGLSERRTYFDMPSPAGGVKLEGPLLCKIAITDGKRASDRSWKPCYAQLRGQALFLFKDKNNASPTPFEDQPISIRSSIVDIAYDYTKKKNVFRLTTYNGSEYLFQADDHDTMLQWIRTIQENSNLEEDKKAEAISEQTTRKSVQQQESVTVNKNSPQVALKGKEKKTSTRSLRSKSPSSHSPGSKPKKQLSEKDLMDPSSQKPKDTKTWKDRMAKKFKRYGSSSSASADLPETSESSEITGTFGVPLEACPCSSFSEYVPLVVEVCTKIVEERGLEYQGIYRVPGNTGAVNTLQEELNRAVDYESLELESEKWMDVNVVSSLLKSFFRKLPEPLITEDLYQAMIAANRIPNQEKRMLKIKKLLHDLPEHNFETFRYIAEHLNKVSEKGDLNKMDGRNLAIVFGPTLIRTSDENMVTMVTDMSDQCRIVESIIANYKWFFSSWFEDVNVPVEEQTDTVPVSGMNQELITKAENLGDRGRDVSVKELMSSVLQAANRKIRKKDKPKTSDSVDIDIESEPNSYNERNIDKEIELRKGKEASQNCLTKESSINLEQLTSSTCTTTTTTTCTAVQESKNSLGPETGSARESTQSGIDAKMSTSTSSSSAGQSSSHGQDKEHSSLPAESSGSSDRQHAGLPIKRYPAYPRLDVSAPQTENSKPALLKKYSCEELARVDWPRADESDHGGEPRREHDEVRKTYGLTAQTRQHLRRIEQETEALRRREQERRKDQERAALARQRIELELQKTRQELEEEHNLDELLSQGTGTSGKLAGYRQKYSNYVNSAAAADNHSVTSDYSTMSSTNTTQGSCQQERQPANRQPADTGTNSRHRLGEQYGCQKPNGRPRPGAGQVARNTYGPLTVSLHSDRATAQQDADDVHKIRKGSLDSLLDVYDRDLAHIDSDEEADHVRKDEERLVASTTAVEPRTAPEPTTNQQHLGKDSHHNNREPNSSSAASSSSSKRSYGNPTWYKAPRSDSKLVGVASRFERVKSTEAKSNDTNPPCFKADNCPTGKLSSAPSAGRAPPKDTNQSATESRQEGTTSGTWSSQSGRSRQVPGSLYKQDSSEQSTDEYISALRKSTEKLFGSGEDLIDLRSPTTETGDRASSPPTWDKAGHQTAAPARRRRHTVGGLDELENRKAMMTATHEYLNRRTVDRRSAWQRLQPKTAVADDVQDIKSWCMHQRLRHVGSSPALFEPRLVAVDSETDGRPAACGPVSSQSAVGDHPSTFSFLSSI